MSASPASLPVRASPTGILGHSYFVLLAAAVSNVGGMFLLVRDEVAAAGCAMGLGTIAMACELSALIGSSYLGLDRPSGESDCA